MNVDAKTPHVTVIVLNMNGARVLGRCLRHLHAQTYPNWDVVVVDNGSTDSSLEVAAEFIPQGRLSVVRSDKNLGCAGGRNLGLHYVTGEVVAFIDNDGFAAPDWLEQAVAALLAADDIGAVASTVFFDDRKIILNGAGGTVNLQGYGNDLCIQQSYEEAVLPSEAVYPMGCGMVVRRAVIDSIGPWDDALPNYYDDVELGLRVWRSGYRVAVAQLAWVDHSFNYSTQFLSDKALLCEKGRVRTVLKYFSLPMLASWAWHELIHFVRSPGGQVVIFRAWWWNLLAILPVLRTRWRFRNRHGRFEHLLAPSHGYLLPPEVDNKAFRPQLKQLTASVVLDGSKDGAALNYGWHPVTHQDGRLFRWASPQASLFLRATTQVDALTVDWAPVSEHCQRLTIRVRPLGTLEPIWERVYYPSELGWTQDHFACPLDPGDYEIVVAADRGGAGEPATGRCVPIERIGFATMSGEEPSD